MGSHYSILYFLVAFFHISLLAFDYQQTIDKLSDIKNFTRDELKIIKHRYRDYQKNPQLFTYPQFEVINKLKLAPIVADLLIHEKIRFGDTEEIIAFAGIVKDSSLPLRLLEKRVIKYLGQGESLFSALRKAVEREQFHQFKIERIKDMQKSSSPFVETIAKIRLSEAHLNKVLNVYAVCIDSFNYQKYRSTYMKPKVCDPVDEYHEPQGISHPVKVRQSLAGKTTKDAIAYRALVSQAKTIADHNQLSTFERVVMAKCIAEHSLHFFQPSHHLFRALRRTCEMTEKSPEEAFFSENGVCSNFSGIAFNIAKSLGLADRVRLAKKGMHVYLEVQERGQWYHAHPFNNQSHCDLTAFKN